ncbi:hypothetical protein BU064_12110 [Staphylococcus succinus]|nr:hypothetical protein BU064_12110 [Staphylococcus succinus]
MKHYNVKMVSTLISKDEINLALSMKFDFDEYEYLHKLINIALQIPKNETFSFATILELVDNDRNIDEPDWADFMSIETAFNNYIMYCTDSKLFELKNRQYEHDDRKEIFFKR